MCRILVGVLAKLHANPPVVEAVNCDSHLAQEVFIWNLLLALLEMTQTPSDVFLILINLFDVSFQGDVVHSRCLMCVFTRIVN